MFGNEEEIENNTHEEIPPAPPPPPGPPSMPQPVELYRKEDTELKEILESQVSPSELKKNLLAYQKHLEAQLETKKQEVLKQETMRNAVQADYEINISELQRIVKKMIEFKDNIELLAQLNLTEEEKAIFSTMFYKKLQAYEQQQKTCQTHEEPLKLKVEEAYQALAALAAEKDKIYFKIKAVERAIVIAEKAGRFAELGKVNEEGACGSKKRKMVLPKDLSVYEAELRDEWQLYLTIVSTKKQITIYDPKEIFALQCAIFEVEDWEGDCAYILQHKLWKAVVERKELIKGLDKTPRANIEKILGYDIIEQHKEREARKKQAGRGQQRQSLKARRVLEVETKEIEENNSVVQKNKNSKEALSVEEIEDSQNPENIQSRKKIRPASSIQDESQDEGIDNPELVSSKKRDRSPKQIALIAELEERQAALKKEVVAKQELLTQEQQNRLKAEEEAALIRRKQEAQLLALKEQEERLIQQEAMLREQEVREARNRAEAEFLKAQLAQAAAAATVIPAKPPLSFAQRKSGW